MSGNRNGLRDPIRVPFGLRAEAGTSILEVTLAMALFALLAGALIPAFASGYRYTSKAKQRDVATALMVETMEQVRALPFATVANGLDNDDVISSGDPHIQISGSVYEFEGEAIPHGELGYTQAPLVPHRVNKTVNTTTYTVGVYPTFFEGSTNVLRVSVIVAWQATVQTSSLTEVRMESILYSDPAGCLSVATHPFSAPCQPFLYANASRGTGSVQVTPAPGTSGPALGTLALQNAQLDLPTLFSSMQIEQIAAVNTRSATSSGLIDAGTVQQTGAIPGAAAIDDDPGSASATSAAVTPVQVASAITASDGQTYPNSITVTPGSADTGTSTSTASATASPACKDLANNTLLTSKPCGSGTIALSNAPATLSMDLHAGSTSLESTQLASVGVAPATSKVFTSRHLVSSPSYCTGTSGDGCVYAASTRSFGTISLAGLPGRILSDGAQPSGWGSGSDNYLIRLSNYSDTTASARGVNVTTTSASQLPADGSGTPTLSYWNGSGYTSLPVDWGASPPEVTVPTVNVTDNNVPGGVTVTITTSVTTGSTSMSSSGPSDCSTACTALASVTSPISVDITYIVSNGGVPIASLAMRFDLGSNNAETSFRAAPSAG